MRKLLDRFFIPISVNPTVEIHITEFHINVVKEVGEVPIGKDGDDVLVGVGGHAQFGDCSHLVFDIFRRYLSSEVDYFASENLRNKTRVSDGDITVRRKGGG